jgi:hypothetical protein
VIDPINGQPWHVVALRERILSTGRRRHLAVDGYRAGQEAGTSDSMKDANHALTSSGAVCRKQFLAQSERLPDRKVRNPPGCAVQPRLLDT